MINHHEFNELVEKTIKWQHWFSFKKRIWHTGMSRRPVLSAIHDVIGETFEEVQEDEGEFVIETNTIIT